MGSNVGLNVHVKLTRQQNPEQVEVPGRTHKWRWLVENRGMMSPVKLQLEMCK